MPGVFDPLQGDSCVLMPCLVISDTRAGVILLPADQKSGAGDLVGKVGLHGLGQHPEPVAGELGVPLSHGYNGNLTSYQNGSIGGYMVKKMIEAQEKQMANK